MRILCTHLGDKIEAETVDALARYAPQCEYVDISYDPRNGYWQEIKKRWTGENDLVIIEQDIVITEGVTSSFLSCRHDWCTYSYDGPPWIDEIKVLTHSIGCARFSKQLQRRVKPDSIGSDQMVYFLIDDRIANVLTLYGYEVCVHGHVKHLHDYMGQTTESERETFKAVHEASNYRNFFSVGGDSLGRLV